MVGIQATFPLTIVTTGFVALQSVGQSAVPLDRENRNWQSLLLAFVLSLSKCRYLMGDRAPR